MAKEELFEKLKDILLERERNDISRRIEEVEQKIDVRDELESRVEPILDDKVTYIQNNFSYLFGSEVTKSIKTQIRDSQDEVVEALYPIIGKMIKKYIAKEFELFSERVDKRFEQLFSFNHLFARIKSWFSGKPADLSLQTDLLEPQIDQILVVEQQTGLLIGSYNRDNAVDQDMVAAMLTAIKSFVGDAYQKGDQDLEMIEFETFKLLIRNFKSFYIVSAVSGGLTLSYKNKIDDLILNFAEKMLNKETTHDKEERYLDQPIQEYFDNIENADK